LAGRLHEVDVKWDRRSALGVVMAAAGYPAQVRSGDAIEGLAAAARLPGKVFHGATRVAAEQGRVVTSGGRVLCAVGMGAGVRAAQLAAYALVDAIHWPGVQYRHDIGHLALARADS
jgi:phosphoribosylamine--glycine ligase